MKNRRIDINNEEEFEKWLKDFHVSAAGKQFDSMIEDHNREIKEREMAAKDSYVENLPIRVRLTMRSEHSGHKRNKNVMAINTSDKCRNRAYRFMNTFIEAIRELGGSIHVESGENEDNTCFSLLKSNYKCSIVESQVKYREIKNKEEKSMRPLYELKNIGKLEFSLYERGIGNNRKESLKQIYSVSDTDDLSLEDRIEEIFRLLRVNVIQRNAEILAEEGRHQKEYEQRMREWEEEKAREEHEKTEKAKRERKRQNQSIIEKYMDKWEHMNRINAYIAFIRDDQTIMNEDKEKLERYCTYIESLYDKGELYKEIYQFIDRDEM